MFAESTKKAKSEKRGRFNAGEKDVLALAIEAKLTTVKGQVLFNEDGTRTEGTETREIGSEFAGRFQLTLEEYEHIAQQAKLLIPPKGIVTLFNDDEIAPREPVGSFTETLPIPLADKEGVMRNSERKTLVNLYELKPGETAMIYEMGIPIVELGDDKWHVNVCQKVPLSRDRDNVNPAYLRKIRVGVLNAQFAEITEADAGAAWVGEAMGNTKSTDEAVKHVMKERFGDKYATRSVSDIGSVKEAVSQGYNIIEGGSMSKAEWDAAKRAGLIRSSHDIAPTEPTLDPFDIIPPENWTNKMQSYASLIELLAPRLIGKPVIVQYINDDDAGIQGCFQKGVLSGRGKRVKREFGKMTVNLAYHDMSAEQNYFLLLHELAHNTLYSNDHLDHVFYDTVTELGAKLVVLAIKEPQLFGVAAFATYIPSMAEATGSATAGASANRVAKK